MRGRELALLGACAVAAALGGPGRALAGEDRVRGGCAVRMEEEDGRGVPAVTAHCRWPVSHERVAGILRDQGNIAPVLDSVSESTVLPDGRVLQVHAMGWGISNRQVTLRFRTRELEGGGVRIHFAPARKQEPLAEGRVQIEVDEGWWEIRPDGKGGTKLRYLVRYDPGGRVDSWMARRFQQGGVARALEELRRAAERAGAPSSVGR